MDPQAWFLYVLACVGLALSPGPNGLLALTHGALYGPRRAVWTAAGGCTGFVALIGASLFGIGALLQATPAALTALKWGGGAYLVLLGVQVWRAPPPGVVLPGSQGSVSGTALYRQALITALSNPKALLFFLAFLPQFMDPARSLLLQFAVMAGSYAVIELAFEVGLAAAAHRISPWLQRSGQRFNQACGAMFVLIGVGLPLRG
jgi:threonine/homoserine/homoserine lactone efflux protein